MALNFNNGGGAIKWAERMGQLKDFSNLKINGFTPTDVDFAYDIGGEVFLFGELKAKGAPTPVGQRRLLMALFNLCLSSGKDCLVIIAEHDTVANEPIDVGNCVVIQSDHIDEGNYASGGYVGMTVEQAAKRYLEWLK